MLEMNIVGRHAIFAALESSLARVLCIEATSSFYSDHEATLAPHRKKLKVASPHQATSQLKEHGVIARIELDVYYSVKEYTELDQAKTVVVLDHLQDPQNLGSAFRHACAFGVDAIIIPKNQAAPLNATVASASVGCLFKVPCILVTNIAQSIQELKKSDFGIIGTGLQKSVPFSKEVFWPKSAIVIGSEGAGMSHLVAQSCDSVVKLPISPACESLNAAVTLALIGYERSQQLKLFR